jgi:hypothetical protein
MLANPARVLLFVLTEDQRVLKTFQQALYLILLLGWCCNCSTNHLTFPLTGPGETTESRDDRGLHNAPYLDQVQCRCCDCGLKGPFGSA